jgi:hypothetical protein
MTTKIEDAKLSKNDAAVTPCTTLRAIEPTRHVPASDGHSRGGVVPTLLDLTFFPLWDFGDSVSAGYS